MIKVQPKCITRASLLNIVQSLQIHLCFPCTAWMEDYMNISTRYWNDISTTYNAVKQMQYFLCLFRFSQKFILALLSPWIEITFDWNEHVGHQILTKANRKERRVFNSCWVNIYTQYTFFYKQLWKGRW